MSNDTKIYVVTGGTSGIGRATAQKLIDTGANVILNSRTVGECNEEITARAQAKGVRVIHVAGDMRDPSTSKLLSKTALAEFGRLDGFVHCAGGPAPGNAVNMPFDDWKDAFEVHVHSAFHLFQATHQALSVRGGCVVLLSSVAALRGCPGNTAYQVAKAALIQMVRALARDHAGDGIRVNAVAPGIIRTPFQDGMTETARQHNVANRIPLGREGNPNEVASMIIQLINNDFITGETVVIDGGMSMRMV